MRHILTTWPLDKRIYLVYEMNEKTYTIPELQFKEIKPYTGRPYYIAVAGEFEYRIEDDDAGFKAKFEVTPYQWRIGLPGRRLDIERAKEVSQKHFSEMMQSAMKAT